MKQIPGPGSSFLAVIVATVSFGVSSIAAAQQPPPIHGVTGTIATDTSVQETTAGGNRVLAKLGSLFGIKRKAAANDAAAEEALSGLKQGTRIVLHYPASPENVTTDERSKQVDAEVAAVNRSDRTVSITLDDGTRQTLQLSDPGDAVAASVVIYYKDRPGQRIAHAFKRIS